MRTGLLGGLLTLSMMIGCGGATKNNMTVGQAAKLSTTNHQQMWHRPMELTHEFVDYCQGESSTTRFLWMRTGGDPAAGGMSLSVFGGGGGLDGNGGWAAARAIDSVQADGIYLHRVVTEKSGFFVTTRRTFVRGRCVKLKPIGSISEERFNEDRYGKDKLKILKNYQEYVPSKK